MTARPWLLDVCCCQGGASAGYAAAGFEVTGVDNTPQPRYPFRFVLADALDYLRELIRTGEIRQYAAVAGSPPCQAHTRAWKIRSREHPDLIDSMRSLMIASGLPWVIENVPGAPLRSPIVLCGAMFGLHTYRHRLFESNIRLTAPDHPPHTAATVKMGRPIAEGDWYHAVGNFSNVPYVRRDMGAPWMNRDGLRESIPPVYAQHIGQQLRRHLAAQRWPLLQRTAS
ncbi:DNA cytosine methyltransferase [Paractinoplanes atraurantiacus]|uniref:DNA (Cytosine-5)-methyltransferase 1 n=1 Tax=Paractinoplanes atraurantiacus TaxID=1036182 RepID=A0A285J0D9_9ACTN|nr:DNA cytosine methyltransferase [Actinoplanes atraurantiacus]SNY53704.1 DNA (cytosine-5)-methyltransferase 1 [Actinoplanes atraurantiacus]